MSTNRTQPAAAKPNPFARVLTALGLDELSSWREAADAVEQLVERADDDASRVRVLERENDHLRAELDETRQAWRDERDARLKEGSATR